MKKKVKDLTVAELFAYCVERESCDACPFGYICFCRPHTPYTIEEEILEQEVEIPEEEEE